MKKLLFLIFCIILSWNNATAQENVYITVVTPEGKDIPSEATKLISTKLQSLLTATGVADNELVSRFILTAKINVVSKDIAPTTPTRVSQKLEVTLFVGDVIEKKLFASHTLKLQGIGLNENKAYIQALQKIQPNSKNLKDFIEDAKQKIADYYSSNCSKFITEAKGLASQGKYDEAIYKLTLVPDICGDCYKMAQETVRVIYREKINSEGMAILNKARTEWTAGLDVASAEKAMETLSQITPSASCYGEVKKLISEIDSKLKADERKEWELRKQELENEYKLERAEIEANKAISVEYARNQPKGRNRYSMWSKELRA